jgi:hypothetical protein
MAPGNRFSSSIHIHAFLGLLLLGSFAGCDKKAQNTHNLTFAVMGDVPYGLTPEEIHAEEIILQAQIVELNKNDSLAFVMHVGDIKKGVPPCEPGVYEKVAGILRANKHPTLIIPGDNKWNDCKDPVEAWQLWEKNFMRFDEHWPNSLGVVRQPTRPENFAFIQQEILFVGINMVGGKVHDWKEWEARIEDDRQWLESQFKLHASDTKAAVIFAHANPGSKVDGRFEYKINAFQPFIEYLDAGSETDYPKPILFIHGDGHKWIEDHPFPTAGERITRIQVTQGGLETPLLVEIGSEPGHPFNLIRTP